LTAIAGMVSVGYGIRQAEAWHPQQALTLLVIAVVASRMKVRLPKLTGTMSVNLPFLLLAVAELNLAEALLVAVASTLAQCWPQGQGRPKPEQVVFNVCVMAAAAAVGWRVIHQGVNGHPVWLTGALLVPLAMVGFFLIQTVPVSVAIKLSEGGSVHKVWSSLVQMTFPYYVLSAGVASMATSVAQKVGWQTILLLPLMYGTYRSFQLYLERTGERAESPAFAKGAAAGG
jgi:hypothetical protein